MISLKILKEKAKKLTSELQAVYYAFIHPKVGFLPKLIIGLALGYALSPIDLIPDFIPVIGLLDDLIIVPYLIVLSIKLIPYDIMEECRQRADKEPADLKKNWFAGVLFIIIWLLLIVMIVKAVIKLILGLKSKMN